jgi:hypothetical protein
MTAEVQDLAAVLARVPGAGYRVRVPKAEGRLTKAVCWPRKPTALHPPGPLLPYKEGER